MRNPLTLAAAVLALAVAAADKPRDPNMIDKGRESNPTGTYRTWWRGIPYDLTVEFGTATLPDAPGAVWGSRPGDRPADVMPPRPEPVPMWNFAVARNFTPPEVWIEDDELQASILVPWTCDGTWLRILVWDGVHDGVERFMVTSDGPTIEVHVETDEWGYGGAVFCGEHANPVATWMDRRHQSRGPVAVPYEGWSE